MGVNDGSKDGTWAMLQELNRKNAERFTCCNMPQNSGKAEAVRQGMLQAAASGLYDYIGYWDADFSTPLTEIDWFQDFSGGQFQHDLILGSRIARLGSNVQRKILRHYLGRVFSTVTSNLLRLRVYDTQCGAKIFKADLVKTLFTDPFTSKWFFDVELLARLIALKDREFVYANTLEVPLRSWFEIKGSKLKVTDFLKVPIELYKIKRRYKL